jgi:hypothetical protein
MQYVVPAISKLFGMKYDPEDFFIREIGTG